jgi:hypothetical protein
MVKSIPSDAFSEGIFLMLKCIQRPDTPAISHQETHHADSAYPVNPHFPEKYHTTKKYDYPDACISPKTPNNTSTYP